MKPLKGADLLDYLRVNVGQPRDSVIAGAGYVVNRGDKQSLQRTRFYEAMSEAHGHQLSSTTPNTSGLTPREAGYVLTVGPKGLVPVGKAYTQQCGLVPGGKVRVIIEDGVIILEPIVAAACTPQAQAQPQAVTAAPAQEGAPVWARPPVADLSTVA